MYDFEALVTFLTIGLIIHQVALNNAISVIRRVHFGYRLIPLLKYGAQWIAL